MLNAATITDLLDQGRLLRNEWTRINPEGRQMACMLAALSPEVARSEDTADCPAELMPQWLAQLTPWMTDCGSVAAWPDMVRRYADLAARWHVLPPAPWRRLEWLTLQFIVDEVYHVAGGAAKPAVEMALDLLSRRADGDRVTPDEFTAAKKAIYAATMLNPDTMAVAIHALNRQHRSAVIYTLDAVAMAQAATYEERDAVRQATADRITRRILDAIEDAVLAFEHVAALQMASPVPPTRFRQVQAALEDVPKSCII